MPGTGLPPSVLVWLAWAPWPEEEVVLPITAAADSPPPPMDCARRPNESVAFVVTSATVTGPPVEIWLPAWVVT